MSVKSSSLPSKVEPKDSGINLIENASVKNETTLLNRPTSSYVWMMKVDYSTITTGFYILAAVSSVVIVYFVFKAIRLRRRNYKVRRYGVIASREDVEMTPLENEDDDEDSTIFDISIKNHSRS